MMLPNNSALQAFDTISSIDARLGLSMMDNSIEDYTLILNVFFLNSQKCLDSLNNYLQLNNWPALFHETHRLYGSAGSIGAIKLMNHCEDILEYKHPPKPIAQELQKHMENMISELLKLIGELKKFIEKAKEHANEERH